MKSITPSLFLFGLLLLSLTSKAQTKTILFQDNFDTNPCTGNKCNVNGYNGWTAGLNNVGPLSNQWFVSTNENGGGAQGTCGLRNVSANGSLHIGTTFAQDSFIVANAIPQNFPCTTGDCGDTYFGGIKSAVETMYGVTGAFATDIAAQSPVINCSAVGCPAYLSFNYINNAGKGDSFMVEQLIGGNWTPLENIPVTDTCVGADGLWSKMTVKLDYPNTANNPDVQIAFRWVNMDDSSGYNNSSATIDSVEVYTLNVPNIGITPPTASCAPAADTLEPTNADSIFNYLWTINKGTPRASGDGTMTLDTVHVAFATPGSYPVYLKVSNGVCSQTDTAIVVVNDCNKLKAAFVPGDTTTCEQVCLLFRDTSTFSTYPIVQYAWTFTGGSIASSTVKDPPQVCYADTGTFIAKLVVTDSYGKKDSVTHTIIVNITPTLVTSDDTAICSGATANLSVSGANTYSWSPSAGLSNTSGTNITATPSGTTTYAVTGTINSCSASKNITVTVSPTLTLSNDTTICSGNKVNIKVSGATTYAWTPSTGLSNTTGANIIASPASTTTYTVTAMLGGCTGTGNITITVNTTPMLSLNADTTICAGSSVKLTTSGATTYAWMPSMGLSNTNLPTDTASPANTTTYTVTGTTNGCSASDSIAITVNPLPTITASNDTGICTGASVDLAAGGASTYAWAPATGLNSTSFPHVIATPTSTTTYTVTGISNGCSNTDSVAITVSPPPTLTTSPNTSVCSGNSTNLTVSGATTYAWSPATGLSNTTGASITALPVATTTYTVVGTSNGCSATDSVIVTVNPSPKLKVSADTSICTGGSASLTVSGATTYAWTPTAGLSSTNLPSTTATPASSTTYTVSGTSNGCTSTDSVVVTVSPPPTLVTSADTTICSGNSATLTVSGATTYSWTPSTGLSSTTGANVTASPGTSTTYTVKGTTAGCPSTGSITVTVNPSPTITGTSDTSICNGSTVTLSESGAATYSWSPSASLNNGTSASVIATLSSSTTYTVTGTGTDGCTTNKMVTVSIGPPPDLTVPSGVTMCKGGKTTLTVGGANTYTWTPSTGLNVTTGTPVIASPTSDITYTVTGTTTAGCTASSTIDVTVNVCPAVVADFSFDSIICAKQCIQFTDKSTGNPISWTWTFNGGNPDTSFQQDPGTICFDTPNKYSITLKVDGPSGDSDSVTKQMIVDSIPKVSVNIDTITIKQGTALTLVAKGGKSYLWSPATYMSNDTIANPTVTPIDTITYKVTVKYPDGCTADTTVTVDVIENNRFFIPTLFTPNGDGANDFFRMYVRSNSPLSLFEFIVFDRWGAQVFHSKDITDTWDGTINGKNCEAGVYVWLYKLKFQGSGQIFLDTGSVTLLR